MDKTLHADRNLFLHEGFETGFWCPVDHSFNEAELSLLACRYPLGEPIRPITLFSCIHSKLMSELSRFPPEQKGAFDNKYLGTKESGGLALEMANTIMKIAKGLNYVDETRFWLNHVTPIHAQKTRKMLNEYPTYQQLFNVWATTYDGAF